MPKPVLIDTDAVNDDALAILLALHSPALEVQGITVVAGAVGLKQAVKNALNLLEIAGRPDVPVYPGLERPLFRQLVMAKTFHGSDGLGDLGLADPALEPQTQSAVSFLADTLSGPGDPKTVVTLGPLTNVAAALVVRPDIRTRIKEIVIVGGAIFAGGNYTPSIAGNCPHSEYNIFVDPEAAHVVFTSGVPLVMVGMDVTEKVLLTESLCGELLRSNPGSVASFVNATTSPYMQAHDRMLGKQGCYIADALAVAYAVDPSSFETRDLYVQVETRGDITRGETVADLGNLLGKTPNVKACLNVDESRVLRLFYESLTGGSMGIRS